MPLIPGGEGPGQGSKTARASSQDERVVVGANFIPDPPMGVLESLGDGLIVEAVYALTSDHSSFGGLSGLWISDDGATMITVSDIGQRWQASLLHDPAGRLTGIENWSVADLPLGEGAWDSSEWLDSEALSGDGMDGLVVSYEGEHRLSRWPLADLDAQPEHVQLPDDLGGPSNSGIEALSTLEGGRLFAVAERVGAYGGEGLMGWVIEGRSREGFVYIPGPGFAPTGAGRLEDTVYVAERSFSLFGGFRTRIVSLPTDAIRPGARLEGAELAAFRWGNFGENFEGIVARRGPDGRIFLYLIADDNFSFFQETLLVQLSLTTSEVVDRKAPEN